MNMTDREQHADAAVLEDIPRVGIMSQWVLWRLIHLCEFLREEGLPTWLWHAGKKPPRGVKALAGIGFKESSLKPRALCRRWGLPYIALEDGFLRSSSLGVEGSTPMSMVVDPVGIYYDASQPSRLEQILDDAPHSLSAGDLGMARELMALMRESGIGKYNNTPDLAAADPLGRDRELVLVVDQTWGDFSIKGGGLSEADFGTMLDAAVAENPGADIRARVHPDCLTGHKRSCLMEMAKRRGVTIESRPVSWSSLAKRAERVYVGTSQAGIEALIHGTPVTCFGMPFYAGWGVTDDRMKCERRTSTMTLEQIVAAAYIKYCRYVDPLTGHTTDALTVARQLALRKAQDTRFAGHTTVIGVRPRRRHMVAPFVASAWGQVEYDEYSTAMLDRVAERGGRVLAWAGREPHELRASAQARNVPVWRLEDGFVRSLGLGAAGAAPSSLVVDPVGIHFDPRHPSGFEQRMEAGGHPPAQLAEARLLREFIAGQRITKYNVAGAGAHFAIGARNGQRRILVPGQVEDDASVRYGSPEIRSNRELLEAVRAAAPDAWIVFKPHPDVEAGRRQGSIDAAVLEQCADQIANQVSIADLYPLVDEVHTMTSSAGFEALLRGLSVVTYGMPFYAGWGLTQDRLISPRRTRRATLDELVATALCVYPMYVDVELGLPCDAWHVVNRLSKAGHVLRRPNLGWQQQVRNYVCGMLGVRP